MSILRLWIIGSIVATLLLLVLGWTLGVSPRLADAASANSERRSVEQLNTGYEATLVELRALTDDLPSIRDDLEVIRTAIPTDASVSTLLGQLNELAESAGVILTSVEATQPALVGGADSGSRLVAVPITITVAGPTDRFPEFARAVQTGPRLVLLPEFSFTEEGPASAATVRGFIFVLPGEGQAVPTAEDVAVGAGDVGGEAPPVEPSTEPSTSPSP